MPTIPPVFPNVVPQVSYAIAQRAFVAFVVNPGKFLTSLSDAVAPAFDYREGCDNLGTFGVRGKGV